MFAAGRKLGLKVQPTRRYPPNVCPLSPPESAPPGHDRNVGFRFNYTRSWPVTKQFSFRTAPQSGKIVRRKAQLGAQAVDKRERSQARRFFVPNKIPKRYRQAQARVTGFYGIVYTRADWPAMIMLSIIALRASARSRFPGSFPPYECKCAEQRRH